MLLLWLLLLFLVNQNEDDVKWLYIYDFSEEIFQTLISFSRVKNELILFYNI